VLFAVSCKCLSVLLSPLQVSDTLAWVGKPPRAGMSCQVWPAWLRLARLTRLALVGKSGQAGDGWPGLVSPTVTS
ncbi:hypothetical protein K438DRAFT_1867584, partial [Mycena galopus ATCC 62051]